MKAPLYILDVSGYLFRAYFALPPMTNPRGEAVHALFGFIRSIVRLFKDFGPDHLVAVFDGPKSKEARLKIYAEYKAHRVKAYDDLPAQMAWAKEFCDLMGISTLEVPGYEADDTIGAVAKWAQKEREVFILTADKDLAQLVNDRVKLINPWKEDAIYDAKKVEEVYGVPPSQIVDYLAIVGDSSDNIPGLSGFGSKTAIDLLKQFGSLDYILDHPEEVKRAKKQKTLVEERDMALLSRQLATLFTDLDFPKEESCFKRELPHMAKLRALYLEMGFHTLLKEMEGLVGKKEKEPLLEALVDDEIALKALVNKLMEAEEIAIDLEATSLLQREALPVGVGFCIREGGAFYVPFNGSLGLSKALAILKPLFEKKSFFGHNIKYDLHVLANVGVEIKGFSFDTLLASYILNSSRRHSLDYLSLHYFGIAKMAIEELIGSGKKEITMDKVEIAKVCHYCCEDVECTFRLKQLFAAELKERKLESLLFDLELPLAKLLFKMERAGIFVDVEGLEAMSKEVTKEIHLLEKEIYNIAGEEFNISSPKQLSAILFEKMLIRPLKKTKTGLSTSADILETLAKEHLIARKILEWRSLEKLRSTYLDALPAFVHPMTGRIHPNFTQSTAVTGRLACQDPNLQNIPIRTPLGRELRTHFKPQKKGWLFLAADYSQIELRLLAHLSGDKCLTKAFLEGEDIHTFTASLIFNVPLDEVTKVQRQSAKAINFGIIYGQQAYGLSQELDIDIHLAAKFIEAYFERYPDVLMYIKRVIEEARFTGTCTTLLGRVREIPEINSSNRVVAAAAERLAVNTPLQGTAADLIKMAMLKIEERFAHASLQSFPILQIHDELIFEVKEEELDSVQKIVKEVMEGVVRLHVPLVVDLVVGKNWGEC